MKNIIDELYDLHLSHHDTDNEDKEYQSTLDRLIKLEAELLKAIQTAKKYWKNFRQQAVISRVSLIAMRSETVSE